MDNMSFFAIAPEVILAVGMLAVILVEITLKPGHRIWAVLSGVAVAGAFGVAVAQFLHAVDAGSLHYGGSGGSDPMVVLDAFSAFAGIVIFAVTGLGLLSAWPLVTRLKTRGAEFVALILIAAIGLHLMTSAANLMMLFLGLEVASISLYVVAGFIRERVDADEAALKYFLLGSFASAVFLFGVALTFAATGSLSIYGPGGIAEFLATKFVVQPGILLAGIALMLVGLGFKVSAAPFHMWAPDVYQGAATGAVGFMAAGVKAAGFAALARVLVAAFPGYIGDWAPAVAVLAALSILVGTLLAIAQTDLKRMLAYSSVAHAGFMLTGLVAGGDGVPAVWFYLAVYVIQLLGAFAVASVVGRPSGGASALSDYAGLAKRAPVLAATMLTMMLAMGGIPLTAGFVGKVGVFVAAVETGYLWLVILGLVASVAGLFFYLRVVVLMYFQGPALAEGPGAATAVPEAELPSRIVMVVATAVTLALGIVPWPLLNVVRDALPL